MLSLAVLPSRTLPLSENWGTGGVSHITITAPLAVTKSLTDLGLPMGMEIPSLSPASLFRNS